MMKHKNILVIADIEGSSGCFGYEDSAFMTKSWPRACLSMTLDIQALTSALLDAGVEKITVKDFHRTGYNIFHEMLPPRVRLISGYRSEPVPGLGSHEGAGALMMLGMHAPSGSGAFLAHTLTSRLARLTVNGENISEARIFASSLGPFGVKPVFFSGCPEACRHASAEIPGLFTHEIDKSPGPENFDAESWRRQMAGAALKSLENNEARPCLMPGPLDVEMQLRDGEDAAMKMARRWKLENEGDTVRFHSESFDEMYWQLIRCCYLMPFMEHAMTPCLTLYNLMGRMGRAWARHRIGRSSLPEQHIQRP